VPRVEDLWVGVIAALSALLGSGLTGFINSRTESKRAAREAIRASDQRSFDREERRYNDRLSAYTAFETAVVKEIRLLDEFVEKHHGLGPADEGVEATEIREITDALVRVQLLGNSPTEQAATRLAEALHGYIYGPITSDELAAARSQFLAAARDDLGARKAS
jgi:hypothetical protein